MGLIAAFSALNGEPIGEAIAAKVALKKGGGLTVD